MKATITFTHIIQNTQEIGTDDEHMESEVYFNLKMGSKAFDTHATIKQAAGSDYDSTELEVSLPTEVTGAFNFEAYREAVEAYYRYLMKQNFSGPGGLVFRINKYIYGGVADI